MAAHGDGAVFVDIHPPGDDDFVPPAQPQADAGQQHVGAGANQWQVPPPWWNWQPPQPQQPRPEPHKVRLNSFWTHQPAVWFTNAEALFETYNVEEDRQRFNLVLPQLSEETLIRVASITSNPHVLATPYAALKARLLEVYQPDVWEQASKILHFRELGDQKPTQLMDEMLALLPPEEVPGILFKQVFLDRLPADVRTHVQGAARFQDCRQLAAAADVVWQARVEKKLATLASLQPPPLPTPQDLAETLAAVRLPRGGGRGNNRSRGKGRGGNTGRPQPQQRPSKPTWVCFRHAKYGDAAWECDDPARCTSSSNVSGN